jgi:hypothetical protein
MKRRGNDEVNISQIQQNTTVTNPQSIFIMREDDVGAFMAWTYLPVAIVTIVGILWEALDVNVRRLEPYHQLSSRKGGNVSNAMCLDYTGMFGFVVPFSAIRKGHYTVALVSTVCIIAMVILPALSGGIFSIEWGSLTFALGNEQDPKFATVSINSGVAIATQVVHGVVAALGIVLTIVLRFRQTGLYHDPKGIGGLAPLISDADRSRLGTLHLFQQIPSFAHPDVVSAALSNITFHLSHFQALNVDGSVSTQYQLATNTPPGYIIPLRPQDRVFYPDRMKVMGFWLTKRAVWLAEIFIWLGQAAITSAIYQTARVVGSSDFANNARPMIAKMVMTLFITIGGLMWTSIQREVQLFEPWRQLTRGRSKALYAALKQSDSISLGLVGSFITNVVRGAFVMLWASFSVLMIQVATIFVPPLMELAWSVGLAGNMAQYREVAVLSGQRGMALAITGIAIHVMIFCNLIFLLASGRTRPFLPRAPTTIASQILYLCRSDMLLHDFSDTSMISNKVLEQKLKKTNLRCLFGWFWWHRGAWYVGVEEYGTGQHWARFDFWTGVNGFNPRV